MVVLDRFLSNMLSDLKVGSTGEDGKTISASICMPMTIVADNARSHRHERDLLWEQKKAEAATTGADAAMDSSDQQGSLPSAESTPMETSDNDSTPSNATSPTESIDVIAATSAAPTLHTARLPSSQTPSPSPVNRKHPHVPPNEQMQLQMSSSTLSVETVSTTASGSVAPAQLHSDSPSSPPPGTAKLVVSHLTGEERRQQMQRKKSRARWTCKSSQDSRRAAAPLSPPRMRSDELSTDAAALTASLVTASLMESSDTEGSTSSSNDGIKVEDVDVEVGRKKRRQEPRGGDDGVSHSTLQRFNSKSLLTVRPNSRGLQDLR